MGIFHKLFHRKSAEMANENTHLPDIPDQVFGNHVGSEPSGQLSGPGAGIQKEASAAWNARNYKKALPLYNRVIELGLDEEYDSSLMHQSLGCCYIMLGDVRLGVTHFLKCLQFNKRAPTASWQSAMYLYYIYDEAGRTKESDKLRQLASDLNTRVGWSHESSLGDDVRSLVRGSAIKVVQSSQVTFDREVKVDSMGYPATYKLYKGPNKKTALAFLEEQNITAQSYFVGVKTPEGTFCKDRMGLFDPASPAWPDDDLGPDDEE